MKYVKIGFFARIIVLASALLLFAGILAPATRAYAATTNTDTQQSSKTASNVNQTNSTQMIVPAGGGGDTYFKYAGNWKFSQSWSGDMATDILIRSAETSLILDLLPIPYGVGKIAGITIAVKGVYDALAFGNGGAHNVYYTVDEYYDVSSNYSYFLDVINYYTNSSHTHFIRQEQAVFYS
ncbi:hypothetical protein [Schleiferilactobacillus shenzhenensis]|uniref:Uncharacterized protein n=1 Tax=Schleiferilactobacillus shenzhenensis LY-73 TaxID=1231336 RepID=U4TMI5_9LACO|nr:hypothetical protein [Schleiferilactobacillus shenzhenensis]ERL65409.1 hypothetical protein L248_2808 [Schleiferilactobacillus shenzhenensis LY-73]